MPVFLPYIIVIIVAVLASFSSLSKGSYFNENIKFIVLVLALIILIVLCIITTISYSWIHIIGLAGTFIISALVSSAILSATIFRKFKF